MKKIKNRLKATLFCLTLLSVVLYACQSDVYDFELEEVEVTCLGIINARNWFEVNEHLLRPSEVLTRSATGEEEVVTLNPLFNWNIAELSRDPNWEVVELSWEYEEVEQIFALWEVWQYAYANNFVPENVTRLVIVQNRNTDDRFGFKMRIAPSLNFLLNHGESLQTNSYLHRNSQLCGIVVFYTLDGEFMNGWRYRNGEITAALTAKTEVDIEDVNVPTTRMTCWGLLDELVITATTSRNPINLNFLLGASSGVASSGATSSSIFVKSERVGGSGGSNGESAASIASQCAPNASQIFSNIFMTCDDWSTLERLINRVKQTCMGRVLFNQMSPSPVAPWRIGFHNAESSEISHADRSITLSRTGDDLHMFHELFHAFQIGGNRESRESEAWFAMFLYAMSSPSFGPGSSFYEAFHEDDPLGRTLRMLNEQVNHRGQMTSIGSHNEINRLINLSERDRDGRLTAAGLIEQINAFGYRLDPARFDNGGINTFRNLQQIARNC